MKLFVFQFCTCQIKEKNIFIGEEEINMRTLFVPDLEKIGKIAIQFACFLFNIQGVPTGFGRLNWAEQP